MSVTRIRTETGKPQTSAFDALDESPSPERPRARWKAPVLGLVTLGLGALAYWQFALPSGAPVEMATANVVRGDVVDSVSATGKLQPRDYVDIGAQVSGQLTNIQVEIGDEVKSGDPVAEIDPAVLRTKVEAGRASLAALRAQLADKEAQRDLANQTLERQRTLVATRAVSETTFESAEATARSAIAQVDMLRAQIQQSEATLKGDEATLGYTRITSPMDGTIVSLDAREGKTINSVQQAPVLMRVADLSTMTVWTQVSEADVPRLSLGMTARFTTLGSGQRSWEGKLRQILPTPTVENNVVLYTALFDVDNPKNELMTEMTAQVFFVVAEANDVLTVPVQALRESPRGSGQYTVEVKTGFGTETRKVETGVRTRILAEVTSGLEEGDQVVLPAGDASAPGEGRRGGGRLRLP